MNSVVLLTVDRLHMDHMSVFGYDRPTTPNIDDFAQNSAMYSNAVANSPITRLAFQSIFTGMYIDQIRGLGIPEDGSSITEILNKEGFETGGFARNIYKQIIRLRPRF